MHSVFLTLGFLFLVGLLADEMGHRSHVPRVTLLILCGVAVGPSGLDLLGDHADYWYEFLSTLALTMIAFLLGGHLSIDTLRENGRAIIFISVSVVVVSAVLVGAGMLFVGAPLPLALLFGGVATATAPAATYDVIRQTGVKGRFVDTLQGIVAIDDAWGLIVFSVLLSIALALTGNGDSHVLWECLWEIGGAIGVGIFVGAPAACLTGRLQPGEPMQVEGIGLVCVCAGLSVWLGVSFLLAGMVAGAIIVNFAAHHTRPFHEIEDFSWPFMLLFFLMAGASLETGAFAEIGLIGIAYIVLRGASRYIGGWAGGKMAKIPAPHARWIGLALTPQAGVALGMAMAAGLALPDYKETLLAVTIGTTVFFEITGPFLTRAAIMRAQLK